MAPRRANVSAGHFGLRLPFFVGHGRNTPGGTIRMIFSGSSAMDVSSPELKSALTPLPSGDTFHEVVPCALKGG